MAIPGVFASDAGTPGDRPCDPVAMTMLVTGQMDVAPLYSLSAGMGRETTGSTIVTWEDHFPIDTTSIVTGNCGNPKGMNIEISNPGVIDSRTLLYVAETGEVLFVVGCNGCEITVKRGFACTPVCPIEANFHLERVTTAFEEGSDAPLGYTYNHGQASNCTMIIRSGFEATGTALATKYRSGDLRSRLLRETSVRHAEDKECALMFSRKENGVIEGRPWRMMDGLDPQILQNRFVCPPSGMDRLLIDAFLQRVFAHNIKGLPNERIFFGSGIVLTALNELGWRYSVKNVPFNTPNANTSFGLKFTEYETIYGTMKVFRHAKLEGRAWGQRLYAVHPGGIKLYDMADRANMFQSDGDGQNNNGSSQGLRDTHRAVMTSEFSMALMQQSVHAVMTNVTPCYYRD